MSTVLGNTNSSLLITPSVFSIKISNTDAISLAPGQSFVNFNNYKLSNVANPTSDNDVLNRIYADNRYTSNTLPL